LTKNIFSDRFKAVKKNIFLGAIMASSRTLEAFERLRSSIIGARYKPGDKLRIDVLCEELDVSLGAVREALSRLTSEGLVVAQPQRGFVVTPISLEELKDLTAVRIHVETLCLTRAIAHGDAAWQALVRESWDQLSRIEIFPDGDRQKVSEKWAAAHGRFHEALVAACDSRWWLRLRQQLYTQTERYRRLSGPYSENDRDIASEHGAIVDATLSGDATLASARLTAHLQATADILMGSRVLFPESHPVVDPTSIA
jgi:GntR family transcriptional regulator, carbon starvation induced regulator